MANRIVQAIYDLKDNVTGKLKNIRDAYRASERDSDKTAASIAKANNRMTASFAAVGKAAKAFGAAIVATAAAVGLGKLADGIVGVLKAGEGLQNLEGEFAAAFGGVEAGAEALNRVKALAEDVPISLNELAEAAVELRKRGFDPLDGTLQALVDNNSALEGSQQDLIRTIETLGKANLRGQINMRAFVDLQQQGIPVAQLLAKATGQTEEEIRKLAQSGQLGGDAIKVLVEELGKLRAGGAAAEMREFESQLTKLRDKLYLIAGDLADGGPLELARDQLVDLNAEIRRLSASPEFAALKTSLAGTFEAGTEAARAFLDNIDLTKQIAQIAVYTDALRDTFRILEASDAIIEPVFDGLSLLTEPFEKMKQAAGIGLKFVADKLEDLKGGATEAKEEIEKIPVTVTELADQVFLANAAIDAFKKTLSTIDNARDNGLSVAAQAIVNDLAKVVESEAETRTAIKGLFQAVGELPDTRLGDIALAIAQIGTDSGIAGTNVREGLAAEIKKLSGEDLLRFQQAAQASFEQFSVSAEEAATVLDATLLSALERLGVSGDSLGSDFTAAGEEIIATFQAVATSAVATGAQIEAGFKAALAKVATSAEAEALGEALENAGKRGVIGLDAAERSAAALRARLREIQEAADPLQDAFERLGITSQRELRNTADTAREAFDQIVSGAQRGTAATEDVRRAFIAYAQAQLDAAKNSSAFERSQVEGMLRVRAQALGVTSALQELGLAGAEAGAQVAGGADQATGALRGTQEAAEGATDAANALGASTVNVAIGLGQIGDQAAITADNIGDVSARFLELLNDTTLYRGGGAQIFFDLQRQSQELQLQLRLVEDQNAQYDELSMRVRDLRAQYELLGDNELRRLAQAQLQLEENQRRAEEEAAKRKAEIEAQRNPPKPARPDNDGGGNRNSAGAVTNVTVNLNGVAPQDLSGADLNNLARKIGKELEKIAGRSR